MAGLISSQPGAVGTSAASALPLSPSKKTSSSGNTLGNSLSFGCSKEVGGDDLFRRSCSVKNSKSKLESAGKGAASLQVSFKPQTSSVRVFVCPPNVNSPLELLELAIIKLGISSYSPD